MHVFERFDIRGGQVATFSKASEWNILRLLNGRDIDWLNARLIAIFQAKLSVKIKAYRLSSSFEGSVRAKRLRTNKEM
ncbi:1939_t:CDS:2 [Funneliformis geosporum]|nr:1939_t:CDS:2 [Funneliformis geosporum]